MALKTRVLCLLTALFLLAGALTSCSGKTVLSYGSQKLDERLFRYALTLNKTKTLSNITGTSQGLTDDPSVWTTPLADGSTYGQLVLNETLDMLKMTLFYCDYAKKNGISLSETEKAEALANVQKVVSSFPSRAEFDRYMKTYGFDYDLLCRYYELDALSQAGMRAYYNHPLTSLTKADVRAYYEENYVRAVYLYVNETETTLPNGKTVLLSEEEKATRTAFFDEAEEAIRGGKPFSDYMKESDTVSSFADGKLRTFLSSSVMPEELKTAFVSSPLDEISVYQGEKGRYLIQRVTLDEEYFEENTNAMTLVLISEREAVILQEQKDSFLLDQAYFDSVDLTTLAIF